MNILIFGLGMYVIGSEENNYGTIFPALIEFQKKYGDINKLIFIKKTSNNLSKIKKKINYQLKRHKTNINYEIKYNINFDILLNKLKEKTVAIICLPDHLHYYYTNLCLKNNISCLVVKPLTFDLDEAKKLKNLAKRKKLYATVEFHKRLDKQNLVLRDTFNNKKFGNLLYSIVEFSQRKIIPYKQFNKWVSKTNILNYLGVHYIDLMRFISGAVPVRVMAIGQKGWLKKNNINTYDSIQCIIEWKINNYKFIQNINVNWIDPNNSSAMSDQKIKLIFTKGRIECDQKNRGIEIISDSNIMEHLNPDFCKEYNDSNDNYYWDGYGVESITNYLNDIRNLFLKKTTLKKLNKIRPTFEESFYSSAVLYYANKSLQSKKNIWIKIKI